MSRQAQLAKRSYVAPEERAKAAFLADYRALCQKHMMMVAGLEGSFVAVDWTQMPSALEIAIMEMLLNETIYVTEPGDENHEQSS